MNRSALNKAIVITFATTLFAGCAHLKFDDEDDANAHYSPPYSNPGSSQGFTPAVRSAQQSPQNSNFQRVSNTTAQMECTPSNSGDSGHYLDEGGKKSEAVKIMATGYGAPPKAFYPDPQRRLMAMRAAKIDAYRNLAERVSGLQVWGGTTIGDMVVEKDRFRVFLDTHLSGARVITESGHEDGTFETIVELKVDQSFLNNTLPRKRNNNDCADNGSRGLNLSDASPNPSMQGNLQNSNFYYQE